MNNKGFAISTMLYGTFLVFMVLMFAMLGMINTFKSNMDLLIESSNGARGIVEKKCSSMLNDPDNDGVYKLSENTYYYDLAEKLMYKEPGTNLWIGANADELIYAVAKLCGIDDYEDKVKIDMPLVGGEEENS